MTSLAAVDLADGLTAVFVDLAVVDLAAVVLVLLAVFLLADVVVLLAVALLADVVFLLAAVLPAVVAVVFFAVEVALAVVAVFADEEVLALPVVDLTTVELGLDCFAAVALVAVEDLLACDFALTATTAFCSFFFFMTNHTTSAATATTTTEREHPIAMPATLVLGSACSITATPKEFVTSPLNENDKP